MNAFVSVRRSSNDKVLYVVMTLGNISITLQRIELSLTTPKYADELESQWKAWAIKMNKLLRGLL